MRQGWRRVKTQLTELWGYPAVLRDLRLREKRISTDDPRPQAKGLIVSFTSMPSRFSQLHLTLRSLLTQSVLPEKIILYLGRDETVGTDLPKAVLRLAGDLFEIRYCDHTRRSYDKLVHALAEFPEKTIVTCDDDKVYPRDWLSHLVDAHQQEPEIIQCHFARKIPVSGVPFIADYQKWPTIHHNEKGFWLLPLGVGGVLYPPNSLHDDCTDFETFTQLAPQADDLWFKFMGLRAGTPTRCVGRYAKHPPSVLTHWHSRLANNNVYNGGNEEVFASLMQKYGQELQARGVIEK